ncbi:ABC transporter permease [Oceanobacillus manasiensis]|uniref:ABC transporter permease n=1 Tax=Oceanobacillus manasiensis TaxID=586413 RepID=UPI0005AA8B59|nr:ABC transporter permease subunit [Oceanobacillus manasiensis]
MLNSFRAEMDKLVRRPATWVFGLVFVILSALSSYGLSYLIYKNPPPNTPVDVQEAMLALVLPENSMGNIIAGLPILGGGIAVIFGAIVLGSEFRWGTFKTIFIHQPKKWKVLTGKLLAIIMVLLVFLIAVFAVDLLISYLIANAENSAITWPSFVDIVKTFFAGWFILIMFAMFGVLLATLFRGTAIAVGLGLVYILVIENMISASIEMSDVIKNIAKVLPGVNASSLASTHVPSAIADYVMGVVDIVGGTQAIFALLAYTLVFIGASILLILRRDVIS